MATLSRGRVGQRVDGRLQPHAEANHGRIGLHPKPIQDKDSKRIRPRKPATQQENVKAQAFLQYTKQDPVCNKISRRIVPAVLIELALLALAAVRAGALLRQSAITGQAVGDIAAKAGCRPATPMVDLARSIEAPFFLPELGCGGFQLAAQRQQFAIAQLGYVYHRSKFGASRIRTHTSPNTRFRSCPLIYRNNILL